MTLTTEQKLDLVKRGFSRRSFGKIASLLAAGSTMPFYNEPAMAQLSKIADAPADAVFINANENPLGPCPEAIEAVNKIVLQGGRYLFTQTDKLQALLAKQEQLPEDHVMIFPGSSAPLHQSVFAFTSPEKPYVTGDPGYEAGFLASNYIGTKSVKVPLLKPSYAHDVKKMAAVPDAGLIYICNPNNPTGTMTPKADIDWLADNKPAGSILMIDEAYTHIVPNGYFSTDLIRKGKDVVILRTFSKVYGMAGLRAGAAMGKPEHLKKIAAYSRLTMMSVTGVAAAMASLNQPTLIPDRRAKIAKVREDVFNYFEKNKINYIPSVSNCVMVDTKRVGTPYSSNPVALAMQKAPYHVYVGRVWPSMPSYVRVTIGLPSEMERFKTAFSHAMQA